MKPLKLYSLIKSLLTAIILISLAFQYSYAEEKTFVIGVEDQQYFPHYHYQNGDLTGYAKELLDAYANSQGYRFIYKALPINQLFKSLVAREIDFKYPDNPYWQHKVKEGVRIAYSDPVTPYIDGVSVLKENVGKGLKHLKRLGTLKGFTPLNYEYMIQTGNLVLLEMNSTIELINRLMDGQIDGIYGNVDVINYQVKYYFNQDGKIVFDKTLPYTAQTYMLSTAKQPRELKSFNIFLEENKIMIHELKVKYHISDVDTY